MEVEQRPIDELIPYARNPRINERAVDDVAASIQAFGFRQPIVVDEDNVILVGHTRMKAARRLGLTEVPVHVASGLSESERKAYRIMDNRAGHESEWDAELLSLEMGDLQEDGFDMDLTGFDEESLAELLEEQGQGDPTPEESSSKEINPDDFEMDKKCPRCGFEFDDAKA